MCCTELFKLKVKQFFLSIFLDFFFRRPLLGLLFVRSRKRNVHDTQNLTFVPTPQTRNLTGVIGLLCCHEIKIHSGKTISSFNIKHLLPYMATELITISLAVFLHLIHPELVYHISVSICQICYSVFVSALCLLTLSSEHSAFH